MPAAPTESEEDRALAAAQRLARAKAALATGTTAPKADLVTMRVAKFGNGLISTGKHVKGIGDLCFETGEIVKLPRDIAVSLERRGFAEIQDG